MTALRPALLAALLAFAGVIDASPAPAQVYPSKPVRIVVPFAAGGRTDLLARLMAQGLQERLGQPFVVENRGGASGSLGADVVAKSPPDGYVLLLATTGPQAVLPMTGKKLPYDADKDFTPIGLIAESYSFFGVWPGLPVKTLQEFIALAKAKPGELNFASSGVGTFNHFAGEFFNVAAGTKITHVPYRGGAPSVTDLVAGNVQMMIGGEFIENAKAGQVRILASTNPTRWSELPDVPTMAEAGLPAFKAPPIWFGLMGPGGMARPLVDRINEESAKTFADPKMTPRLVALGSVALPSTPEQFQARIKGEMAAFVEVAKAADMKFED
jgi:tripartite-type tricarboxylate transporter receptor subunit TctC